MTSPVAASPRPAAALALAMVLSLTVSLPAAAAPEQPREQRLLIALPGTTTMMRTRVVRPAGPGPFRLAVINHGTDEDPRARQDHVVAPYKALVALLVRRGYAVAIPQRPGHGETGGAYAESAGGCQYPDFLGAANGTAKSIQAVIEHMTTQSDIRRERAVVVGHSAGAWGALGLAARHPELVERVVNFAGGRGGRSYGIANQNCAPEFLIETARDLGRTTRVPTLWLYANNDSYFGPALVARMAEAFRAAGGPVELRMLPDVPEDGHYAIHSDVSAAVWLPIVDAFLRGRQPPPR